MLDEWSMLDIHADQGVYHSIYAPKELESGARTDEGGGVDGTPVLLM